jgi:hypothetical protein
MLRIRKCYRRIVYSVTKPSSAANQTLAEHSHAGQYILMWSPGSVALYAPGKPTSVSGSGSSVPVPVISNWWHCMLWRVGQCIRAGSDTYYS